MSRPRSHRRDGGNFPGWLAVRVGCVTPCTKAGGFFRLVDDFVPHLYAASMAIFLPTSAFVELTKSPDTLRHANVKTRTALESSNNNVRTLPEQGVFL